MDGEIPVRDKKTPRSKDAFSNENERWAEEASSIADELHRATLPIFEKYYAQGYKARELSHLLMGVAWELELMTVL